jgi:hypothetical protein
MSKRPPVTIDAFDTLLAPGAGEPTRTAPRPPAVAAPAPVDSDEVELFRQSFSIYRHQLDFLRETAMRIKIKYPRADVDQGTIVRALLDVAMDVFTRSDLEGVRSERTMREALLRTVGDPDAPR